MNGKQILESIINNEEFNLKVFENFFRQKNDKLRFPDASLPAPEQTTDFSDGRLLAEGDLEDSKLIVCSFQVNKELAERSGKKAQYAVGKRILKEQSADAGIFIFYDEKGNFRFSLIYTNYLGKRPDYSSYRRFTYFVSRELTNKTFLGQIGEGDLSTIEKIKEAFSVEKVTKEFYSEIANWYFWAVKKVTFPPDAEKEENGRNIAVIRMITRIIFVWFMKEKGLVPPQLFNKKQIGALLTDISPNESTYYKAILQNLFFATLNTKMEDRKFRFQRTYQGRNNSYMDHTVYRYEKYFKDKDWAISLFKDIPFLNGGLFDCLDRRIEENGKNKEIRIDGFSDKELGLSVPNVLFFSDEKQLDLNKEYGTHNKNYKVIGLIDLLSSYNFTIDENVPDDQEVALDPELLGKVFENLLASYNPETATTARKATGSYYTPREIVDYMVTESLKQYLQTSLDGIDSIEEKLEWLFSPETDKNSNPFDTATARKIVALIDSLRIVDPAVGSGAFPMGILNKLVFILSKLDPQNISWKETQIEAVYKNIKDPILQNKFNLQIEKQFQEKNPDYGRKLYLIEKCIYGVDIQQIAIEIAKLRFFISLLVDEKIDPGKPNSGIESLPNLDFKLIQGNSLISSFAGIDFEKKETPKDKSQSSFAFTTRYDELIKQFEDTKNQYQNEPDKDKKDKLREKIETLLLKIFEEKLNEHLPDFRKIEESAFKIPNLKQREDYITGEKQKLAKRYGFDFEQAQKELIAYTEGRKPKNFFLWDVYFAEVFTGENSGFDIVIANPPYIDSELMVNLGQKDIRAKIQKTYTMTKGNWDIYVAFFESGLRLMNKTGTLTFITPDKWISKPFGDALRKATVDNIFGIVRSGRNIFEGSNVDSIISFFSKANCNKLRVIDFKDKKFIIKREIDKKTLKAPFVFDYLFSNYLELLFKIETMPFRISELANCENACATSDAYKLSFLIEDFSGVFNGDKQLKIINTGTIGKYYQKWGKRKMTYLGRRYLYPVVDKENFLRLFKNTYSQKSIRPKIIIKGLNLLDACLDLNGSIIPGKSTLIIIDTDIKKLKFLLSIINSKLAFFYLRERYPASSYNLGISFTKEMINNFPLPSVDESQHQSFICLVDKILAVTEEGDYLQNPQKQAKVKEYESQIDQMLYQLYGLTKEEIKIIENNVNHFSLRGNYGQE